MIGEFDLIARYFRPLAAGQPGALGLADDAAVLAVAPGHHLVVTADALVAGVHFLEGDAPDLIARKALRVNLSDLAAMGARPIAYFLTAALPPMIDEGWVSGFVAGLRSDQQSFGIALAGGDTVATPGPLTLSITALGEVRAGTELRRNAAVAGHVVLVSGTLGDAALGLRVLRGDLRGLALGGAAFLADRYHLPQPRLALGRAVAEASLGAAAIDVSDGLLADLGHICAASGLGAEIEAGRLPLSAAAAAALELIPALEPLVWSGGDDYELLLTLPPERVGPVQAIAEGLKIKLTAIGRMAVGSGVRLLSRSGTQIPVAVPGYRHF